MDRQYLTHITNKAAFAPAVPASIAEQLVVAHNIPPYWGTGATTTNAVYVVSGPARDRYGGFADRRLQWWVKCIVQGRFDQGNTGSNYTLIPFQTLCVPMFTT